MSWRRFAIILGGLPIESQFKTAMRNTVDLSELPEPTPGVYGPWPQTDQLIARGLDLLEGWMWANSDPEKRPASPPPPYPRPGVDLPANVRAINSEAMAYLEYLRAHQGAEPPPGWEPEVV